MRILLHLVCVILLTLLTQVGGILWLLALGTPRSLRRGSFQWFGLRFVSLYLLVSLALLPLLIPFTGREPVQHKRGVRPAWWGTCLLNRQYVKPEINALLQNTAQYLEEQGSPVKLRYLDANFPLINGFPLLPHLSHSDGEKIDLALVYETPEGDLTTAQKSTTGYGVFASPRPEEPDQPGQCARRGYWQYGMVRYFQLGRKNNALIFSRKGTRELLKALLQQPQSGKVFLEPHLQQRLQLQDRRIRYHGCHSVRHDDHIHLQL